MEDNSGKKYLFGLIGLLVLGFAYWYVSNPIVISVTGAGVVTVPATYVSSSVTLAVTGENPNDTLSAFNTKATAVRELLMKAGVTEENISQTQPQITPSALVVAGAKGYQATATMSFKTRYVTDIGKMTVDLYNNGATVVSQPIYQVENQEIAEQEATKEAMSKAEKEGKIFARSKMKLIKKIVGVQQVSSGSTSQAVVNDSKSENQLLNASGGVQIAKAVQVTYRMW